MAAAPSIDAAREAGRRGDDLRIDISVVFTRAELASARWARGVVSRGLERAVEDFPLNDVVKVYLEGLCENLEGLR